MMKKIMALIIMICISESAAATAATTEKTNLFQVKVVSYSDRSALRKAHDKSLQQAIAQFMTSSEIRDYTFDIRPLIMDQVIDKFITDLKIETKEELKYDHKYTISVTVNMEALKATIDSFKPEPVAVEALQKVATAGDLEAQKKLAKMYYMGKGVQQNFMLSTMWYRMAAEQGDAMSQQQLWKVYSDGRGAIKKDEKEAKKWLQLAMRGYLAAAEQGDANAQFNFGQMCLSPIYFHQNQHNKKYSDEAMKWIRMAAAQRHAEALYTLGWIYDQGLGVPKDKNEAAKWYRLAVEQGYTGNEHKLELQPDYGRGVKKGNSKTAKIDVKVWQEMASGGDKESQYELGSKYENGQDIQRDYTQAMKWYQLAAKQGHAKAQYALGQLYRRGTGVPQDVAKAFNWYTMAAEQGLPIAQDALGTMYDYGWGVPEDAFEALKWYREAVKGFRIEAEQGDAVAQSHMGDAYGTNDKGVRRDEIEAARWDQAAVEGFRAATAEGDAAAQYNLGRMLRNYPTKEGRREALKWYRAAAEQGHQGALEMLASIYYYGTNDVRKDKMEARYWLQKGAMQGLFRAQDRLDDWFWHCEITLIGPLLCGRMRR